MKLVVLFGHNILINLITFWHLLELVLMWLLYYNMIEAVAYGVLL